MTADNRQAHEELRKELEGREAEEVVVLTGLHAGIYRWTPNAHLPENCGTIFKPTADDVEYNLTTRRP